MDLRAWQIDALHLLDTRRQAGNQDFLCVATPGAGKTPFALTAARTMLDEGTIQQVIVVVPTSHLRRQWAIAAKQFRIDLDDTFDNGVGAVANDFDGAAITFQSVTSQPLVYRELTHRRTTLVIFDEIHHAGESDNLKWGAALVEAFDRAAFRLMLSGTPFRTDGRRIPWVRYDDNGKVVWDSNYSYGDALVDGVVVRPIEFIALSGSARWLDAGAVEPEERLLDKASDDELANALRSVLSPEGEWIPSVLQQADERLTQCRLAIPEAGGLVLASDMNSAKQYARLLGTISGEAPIIALSDDPTASRHIERFTHGTNRWLVAVRMVSEGVDIPRLCVGVYATNTRTEVFLRQVTGRFVRKPDPEDELTASLYIPSIQPLLRFAAAIERDVDDALKREIERAKREWSDPLEFDLVEALPAGPAIPHSTIRAGESYSYTDAELRLAQTLAEQAGMPPSVTPLQAARLLELAGKNIRIVGKATVTPSSTTVTKSDERHALRKTAQRLANRLQRLTGQDYSYIHHELNKRHRRPQDASCEDLRRRIATLESWLNDLQ